MMTTVNVRSTPFELMVRKDTRFDFSGLEDVLHTDGNLYISHFFNSLSLVTPVTEGVLIRAIREAQPLLPGSGLEADAAAFIGQEAIHSREHRALNRRLAELGFDASSVVDEFETEIRQLEETMTLQERLALVVAGEHAIYALARALLASNYGNSEQNSVVKALFVWHALEEMEHQSVCDDIYRQLFGWGMKHRIIYLRMYLVAGKLLSMMLTRLMRALRAKSRGPEPGEFKAFLSWLLHDPGVGVITLRELLVFFSPGFSHWSRREQDQELIQRNLEVVLKSVA